MKEWVKALLSALALVIIFGVAALGYNYLSKNYNPEPVLPGVPSRNEEKNDVDNEADGEAEPSSDELNPAPDFGVYDLEGNKVNLSDMLGKPVIINVWATWCGPCKQEMPHFQKAFEELSDEIQFMMINPCDGVNDTRENIDRFLAENPYTFPVFCDKDVDLGSKYPISGFPTTFFVTSTGHMLGYYPGTMSEDVLYDCIDILLSYEEGQE